jgi:hypothetical protein
MTILKQSIAKQQAELRECLKVAAAKVEAKAAKRRAINRRYDQSAKGKARSAKHRATTKRRESQRKYDQSEKRRAVSYKYRSKQVFITRIHAHAYAEW